MQIALRFSSVFLLLLVFFCHPCFCCSTFSHVPHGFCSICSTFPIFAIFSTFATVLVMIFPCFAQFFRDFAACQLVFVSFLFHFPFQIQLIFLHKKRCPVFQSISSVCFLFVSGTRSTCFLLFPVRWFPLFERSHPRSVPSPRSSFRRSCGSLYLRCAWQSPVRSGRRSSVPASGIG